MSDVLELTDISKTYTMGKVRIRALQGVDLKVQGGAFVAIAGPSGSGKTTLLHILGCLDPPSEGTMTIQGRDVVAMKDRERTLFRKDNIGFVFQFFNLVPTLTARENVLLPRMFEKDKRVEKADEILARVGMGHRLEHRPAELSGGERQRIAIARALMNDPPIILADEPTGNLDTETGRDILRLFRGLCAAGKTVIMVTHEREVATLADMVVNLRDGHIVFESSDTDRYPEETPAQAPGQPLPPRPEQ